MTPSARRFAEIDRRLADLAARPPLPRPEAISAARIVCAETHADIGTLFSPCREQHVVFARALAMHIARAVYGWSSPVTGAAFGGRSHSMVLYGCKTIAERVRREPAFARTVDRLKAALFAQREEGP